MVTISHKRAGVALAAALGVAASTAAQAQTGVETPTAIHGSAPAGVMGVHMLSAGGIKFSYTPTFMHMEGNLMGTQSVSPETIVTTVPSGRTVGGVPEMMRVVPKSMDVQMHSLAGMYAITDWLNVNVKGVYLVKSMVMTTYAGTRGTTVRGDSTSTTQGFGDTSIGTLVRLYQSKSNHVHLNLALSLPTGSTTEDTTMLSPAGVMMTSRGNYGMQLGSGTFDALPGLTYLGQEGRVSWGVVYRGRFPLQAHNDHGYRWGDMNELTGWTGYSVIPGVIFTARVDGSVQDKIHGADPQISGLMQGSNPQYYGGEQVGLFGGVEIHGNAFGLNKTRLAVEGGAPVYQNLNGPQLARDWQVTASLNVHF